MFFFLNPLNKILEQPSQKKKKKKKRKKFRNKISKCSVISLKNVVELFLNKIRNLLEKGRLKL